MAQIVQGHLTHKKQRPPRTLQQDYAQGPMVALGGWAVSYERGTPVHVRVPRHSRGWHHPVQGYLPHKKQPSPPGPHPWSAGVVWEGEG